MNKYILAALKRANKISLESDYTKHKLGAVIFYKNKIVSEGCNQKKNNPLQRRYNIYRAPEDFDTDLYCGSHAEINALRNLPFNLDIDPSKLSILVFRKTKDNNLAMARPCKSCERALKEFGIKNVYYTNTGRIVHEEYFNSEDEQQVCLS